MIHPQAQTPSRAAQAALGGRFSAYSQIVFPALIFDVGKLSQYAHIGPDPKSKINGDFSIPRPAGPSISGGRKWPRHLGQNFPCYI